VAAPVTVQQPGFVQRSVTFYHDVMGEMKKVTWPDWPQVRQLSFGVILLSLFIGGLIAIMDVVMQQVLVRWIPSLFGG
jgi:preprotein translocase subunit SecE